MPPPDPSLTALQRRIWNGSLPLEIRLAPADCRTFNDSDPYLVHVPRLSYLAFVLPRLHAFFGPKLINTDLPFTEAWLDFESVPLKWHYPTGLLYDVFSGAKPADGGIAETEEVKADGSADETLPWKLTLHYSDYPGDQLMNLDVDWKYIRDAYTNAVKEADFMRNGSARTVMGMSKEDSDNLWRSIETHDMDLFNSVNNKLLSPPGVTIRHVPLKVYLPTAAAISGASETIPEEQTDDSAGVATGKGHIRPVQHLIPLQQSSGQPQTLGTALHDMLPSIFISRRNAIYAQPVLHGAVVPLSAKLEDLGRFAGYGDGFLHFAVTMLG